MLQASSPHCCQITRPIYLRDTVPVPLPREAGTKTIYLFVVSAPRRGCFAPSLPLLKLCTVSSYRYFPPLFFFLSSYSVRPFVLFRLGPVPSAQAGKVLPLVPTQVPDLDDGLSSCVHVDGFPFSVLICPSTLFPCPLV